MHFPTDVNINYQHVFLCLGIFLSYFLYTLFRKPKYNVPHGPRGLPILGNLPFLGSQPQEELSKWGKKYGGIFSIYLGREHVVAVTDFEIMKSLLNKTSAADRPPDLFQLLPGGVGFAEANGPEWAEQRRHSIVEMRKLGLGTSHWEEQIEMELSETLELLTQTNGKPADVYNILKASVSNNILSLVSNQRLPTGHPERDIVDHGIESFELLYSPSGLIIHYPNIFRIATKLGLLRVAERVKNMMKLNEYVRKQIEKIKKEGRGDNCYISTYLEEIERNKQLNLGNYFNETNLIGNAQALIIAGSDTTSVSLLWLLLAMASYPEVQEKVHQELDAVVGKHETVRWIERDKLPYCLACVMEGQRWRTVTPLNLLHRASKTISINGYDIPEGTNIITVLWAVNHDTKYWKNPEVFEPERFLTSDGKLDKEPEAYLPFASGKRVCPGKTVALIELFHYFQSIMRNFQVLPSSDTCPVELEGISGNTLYPKRQLLRFVSRC